MRDRKKKYKEPPDTGGGRVFSPMQPLVFWPLLAPSAPGQFFSSALLAVVV